MYFTIIRVGTDCHLAQTVSKENTKKPEKKLFDLASDQTSVRSNQPLIRLVFGGN